jgi:hypothetical protein
MASTAAAEPFARPIDPASLSRHAGGIGQRIMQLEQEYEKLNEAFHLHQDELNSAQRAISRAVRHFLPCLCSTSLYSCTRESDG